MIGRSFSTEDTHDQIRAAVVDLFEVLELRIEANTAEVLCRDKPVVLAIGTPIPCSLSIRCHVYGCASSGIVRKSMRWKLCDCTVCITVPFAMPRVFVVFSNVPS